MPTSPLPSAGPLADRWAMAAAASPVGTMLGHWNNLEAAWEGDLLASFAPTATTPA